MKDNQDLENGKITGTPQNSEEIDGKISGHSTSNVITGGIITSSSSSVKSSNESIEKIDKQFTLPTSRKERISASTLTKGLKNLPTNFGDSDGDWKIIESDNLFEVLYLDHNQINSINPDIVKNNYEIIEKFWKEKKNLWESQTQTIRKRIEDLYNEKNLTNCLNKIQNAYRQLSTIQGITDYSERFKEKRLKEGQIKLDTLLKMMIKDGEADIGELEHVFDTGLKLDFSEEEIASVIKNFFDSNRLLPYGGKTFGNNLKEQLFSVVWLNDERKILKEKEDEEKKKRGREIFDNVFAYSTEEIGEILFKNEGQAKEFIRDGLVINSIDYFSSAKAKQIIEINRQNIKEELKYLQIVYRLNPNLPFKFNGKEYKNVNDLTLAFFEEPDIAKKYIASGRIDVWLKETQKESHAKYKKILDIAENIDLIFLHFVYNFNPKLPFRFGGNIFVKTPEQLCEEINKNLNNWNAGKKELYDTSIFVWLNYIDQSAKVEKWKKMGHKFDNNEDLGLEEFLHIINNKYEYAKIKVNKTSISYPEIQSGDVMTMDVLVENETRGFTNVSLSFSLDISGVSKSTNSIVFNSAAGVFKSNFKVSIDTKNHLKGVKYKTNLILKSYTNQIIEIPISFEVVFPKKAFVFEITKFASIFSLFFIIIRLLFSTDYSDWILNNEKYYLGWSYLEIYYKDYLVFGWTFLLFTISISIGIYYLIKYLFSSKKDLFTNKANLIKKLSDIKKKYN